MKPLTTLFLLLFCVMVARAGILSGTVKDEKGNPLPFASVYVQGTTKGTSANEKGNYHLDLSPGAYDIVFMFIGYHKKVEHVVMDNGPKTLDMILQPEDVKLNEVVVKASEDPAYDIMRHAIAAREDHYREVQNFNCQAYVKGLQRIIKAPNKILGFTVNFDGSLDSNNAGIVYLSESVSDFTFRKPDDVKEVMISSKVSGRSQSFSWNRAADLVQFDFYKNEFSIDILSDHPFISPLANNAMIYYKYHLAGTFVEDGKLIYKIQCLPKAGSGPVFEGYIYITDNDWSLHSVDLMLTKKHSLINYVDTLRFNYSYIPVNDSLSVPLSQKFDFTFDVLKIKAAGYIVAVYRDYKVNMPIPRKTFTDQVMKISDESNARKESYWDSIRPVPLTDMEIKDYARKDTLEKKKESKTYLDSIDRKKNKPSLFFLFMGYNYTDSYHKLYISFFPPLLSITYNTVQGWNFKLGASIRKEFKHRKELDITPAFLYGFSNGRVNGTLTASYLYNRPLHASFDVEGGRYAYQFNDPQPIASEMINSIYTLFVDRNYMKIYEDRFVRINQHIEPVNGLQLYAGINVSDRYHLDNTSYEEAIKFKGREFTPNYPEPLVLNETASPSVYHDTGRLDATILKLSVRYLPGQKYISRPDMKIELDSKWPEFTLSYDKAVPGIAGSQVNYDYLALKINQSISEGSGGLSRYSVTAGAFPNNNYMGFMDYHHFNGNQTIFGINYFTGFQLLPYYAASTNTQFVEAHFEHHFNGLMINRVPKLNKLGWELVLGAHYLYTPQFKSYGEVSIGIENILKVLRVDFVNGLSNQYHYQWGFRIGLNIFQQ